MKHAKCLGAVGRLAAGLVLAGMSAHANSDDTASRPASAAPWTFDMVLVPASYYEYTGDGSGTIGLITSATERPDMVNFTDCNNKTTPVSRKKLRQSSARCPESKHVVEPWTVASSRLLPVYRVASLAATTYVTADSKTVDIASFLNSNGARLPETPASAPIGFAFKDAKGKPSIAILAQQPDLTMGPGFDKK